MISVLRYVLSVVTGTLHHWNVTHNVLYAELWEATENFEPRTRDVLREMLTWANVIIRNTISPNARLKCTRRLRDLKLLNQQNFRELYALLLSSFYLLLPTEVAHDFSELPGALRSILPTDHWITEIADFPEIVPNCEPKDFARHVAEAFSNTMLPLRLMEGLGAVTWQYAFSILFMNAWLDMTPKFRAAAQA